MTRAIPSMADPPFACPPDPIILDLPVPPSVNKTRKINWRAASASTRWIAAADALVMSQGRLPPAIFGPWEMLVTMSADHWLIDPDNGLKFLIDYCRRLDLIENDSPRFARRIVLEWGEAPEGCRITIKPAASV
jgi:hypothetical protein